LSQRKSRLVASCSDAAGGGLREGGITEYNISGEVVETTSGKFSTWTPTASPPVYTINTGLVYSTMEYKYDGLGRIIATRDRAGLGTTYSYYDEGASKKVMSGEVNWGASPPTIDTSGAYSEASYTYYDNGWSEDTATLLDSTGGGTSSTVTNTYYDDGSLEQVTGPKYDASNNDMIVKYEYDYTGRTTKTERLVDVSTWAASQTTYDEYGRVATTATPEEENTNYNYDDYTGRLISVISPESRATTHIYNDFGQTIYTQTANPNSGYIYSHTLYDDLGRPTHGWISNATTHNETAFNNGYNRSKTHYESGKNRVDYTSVYDDDGTEVSTEYEYDALGRVTATCFNWDSGSGLALGSVTTFDELGRTVIAHTGKITGWGGTVSIDTGEPNIKTENEYDDAGRLEKSIQNPDGGGDFENLTTWYRYDELSRQTKVYDPKGYAADTQYYTEYFYDNAGRMTKVTSAEGKDTEYTYYESGSRKTMSYTNQAGTGTVEYFYYASGQLKRAEFPASPEGMT
jgi:YD repeat-containing protein